MKSVQNSTTSRYIKFLTLSLFLGLAMTASSKKMIEFDAKMNLKKINPKLNNLSFRKKFSFYGKGI
jgi:hypothetical protein